MTIRQTIRGALNRALQHTWLVLVPATLCFVGAALWASVAPDDYQSTAVLAIRMTKPSDGLIRSAVVASAREMISSIRERMLAYDSLHEIAVELKPFPELAHDTERVVRRLRERVAIRVDTRSHTVKISMTMHEGENPAQMAHDVVTALVKKYTENQSSLITEEGSSVEAFLEANAKYYLTELENKEAVLEQFRLEHQGSLPEDERRNRELISEARMRISSANERIERNRLSRESTKRELLKVQASLRRVNEEFDGDAEVNYMRRYLQDLRQSRITARGTYTETSDVIKQIDGQIASAEKAIATLIDRKKTDGAAQGSVIAMWEDLLDSHRKNLELLDKRDELARASAAAAEVEIVEAQQRIVEGKKNAARYTNLLREVADAKEWRSMLYQKFQDAQFQMRFQKADDATPLKSISVARVPRLPVGPKRLEMTILGLFVGLGLGVGLAFLKEKLDGSIRNSGDLRLLLPGAVVVTLPDISATSTRVAHFVRDVLLGVLLTTMAIGATGVLGIRMGWWGSMETLRPLIDLVPSF